MDGHYLDFFKKCRFSESDPRSLPNYIGKLKEKRQPDAQQNQANEAVHIYYELIRSKPSDNTDETNLNLTYNLSAPYIFHMR